MVTNFDYDPSNNFRVVEESQERVGMKADAKRNLVKFLAESGMEFPSMHGKYRLQSM